jgi:hypothetical protein
MLQVPRDIQVAFERTIEEALVRREERPTYRKSLNGFTEKRPSRRRVIVLLPSGSFRES